LTRAVCKLGAVDAYGPQFIVENGVDFDLLGQGSAQ